MRFKLDPLSQNGVSVVQPTVVQGGGSTSTTSGVSSLAKEGETALTGAVTLSEGTGISLTQSGQDIEIAATGGGGGSIGGSTGATDNAIIRANGTGGATVQSSTVTIDDLGNISTTGTVDGRDVSTDGTKLDGIESGAEVNNISDANATDLTDAGDTTLHYHASDRNRANHTGTQTASTISDFDTEVSNNASVAANTAKVTNATHTGEVTGSGALTIADNVVDEANLKVNVPTDGYVLTADAAEAGGMKWAATSGSGDMLASVYDPTNIASSAFDQDNMVDGTTNKNYTATEKTKLAGVETGADVTDTANVTSAGALMDSEVASLSGIKTLTVPDSTTISTFGASLVDDLSAAAARTTLNVDVAGTDNSTNVTLAGEDFLSLTGQQITANAIDLDNLSATGTPSSSTFLRGDNTWAAPAGGGDVVGPASSTDNAVVRFDGTTGKLVQNSSGVSIDDSNNLTIGVAGTVLYATGNIDAGGDVTGGTLYGSGLQLGGGGVTATTILDQDTMSSNSATALASQQSIKAYVDNKTVNNSNWSGTDLSVANGGTGASTLASGNFLQGNGTSAVTATKAVPTGVVVGTTDTQTLTNKTIAQIDNTISPVAFKAYRTTNFSFGSGATFTKLTYETEEYDLGSGFDLVNNKFTAPVTGIYHFSGRFSATASARAIATLYKNGTEFSRGSDVDGTNARGRMVSTDMKLTAGDYVEMYGWCTNSGTASASIIEWWFTGHLVGRTA